MSVFTELLVVSPLSDGKTWVILRPFSYAARWFGGLAWKRNQRDRKAGFQMVPVDSSRKMGYTGLTVPGFISRTYQHVRDRS
jgi:hypothetical protein